MPLLTQRPLCSRWPTLPSKWQTHTYFLIPSSSVSCYKISLSLCSPPHVATGSGLWAFPLDSHSLPCFLIFITKDAIKSTSISSQDRGRGIFKSRDLLSGSVISASGRLTQGQFPVSSRLAPQPQSMYSSALLALRLLLKLSGFCCQSSSLNSILMILFLPDIVLVDGSV